MNLIPVGIIIDGSCILLGTILGSLLKNYIPERIKQPMNIIFGIAAMAIGIISLMKIYSLPALILALLLSALIGEIIKLEFHIKNGFSSVIHKLKFKINENQEEYMHFYIIVAVMLCASGTNIFGAISEGVSGNFTILLSKGIIDIFAATLFASVLGWAMNLILIPQMIILCFCFYSAQFLMPYITNNMLNDFIAIGGLLTFVLGFNIAKIKEISAANLLPSLILIWPCSLLFSYIL